MMNSVAKQSSPEISIRWGKFYDQRPTIRRLIGQPQSDDQNIGGSHLILGIKFVGFTYSPGVFIVFRQLITKIS
jgi:hypothetical protein